MKTLKGKIVTIVLLCSAVTAILSGAMSINEVSIATNRDTRQFYCK